MKRALVLAFLAGCGAPETAPKTVTIGMPGSPRVATCDALGRWGLGGSAVEHWIYDPADKKEHDPSNGGAKSSLFRDSLPFPQFSWGTGDFEVTQLLVPVGQGFMARYHVMNHGEQARTVRLIVGQHVKSGMLPPLVPATKPTEKSESQFAFDLEIEAGASQFVVLTTPEAAGRDPNDALDEAVATWEKLLSRPISIQDAEAQSAYVQDLAGRALGVKGADRRVRTFEERFVKREGDALRLMGDVPEAWLLETIEVKGLKTDFGPITLRHVGFYNSRTLDLEPGCSPPGGFLLGVDQKHRFKIDGKSAEASGGVLRIPAGTKRVELARIY
jgi:hypothetical protein